MRGKLTLRLEELSVESFDTSSAEKSRGTVIGEQCTCPTACTCPGCPSCYESCNGSCGATCPATCAYTCDDPECGTGYSCDETGCDCSINATRCGGYICP
ncbi:MAG TPA: hypothetical protein VF006_22030 [Longimicrobium sp.]